MSMKKDILLSLQQKFDKNITQNNNLRNIIEAYFDKLFGTK